MGQEVRHIRSVPHLIQAYRANPVALVRVTFVPGTVGVRGVE
ncbi:hypothetical protein ACIBQ5_36470 [Streptomyces massasporeus]